MPLRPKMELRDYAALFLRRKWMIVFSFLFLLLAASVYCVVAPELYKSSTTILIIPQSVPEDYVRSTVSVKVEQQLSTIKQQVLSRTTLSKVMDELRLFEEERRRQPAEEVVERMRKRIEIEVVQGKSRDSSDAFILSFLHENPRQAMHGAARLASFFIDENLKTREQQAVGTSDFLESQLRETKAKLEEQEAKVKDYKMQYTGELPQQLEGNLRILTGLQDRLRSNEASLRSQEDRGTYLEAQLNLMKKSTTTVTTDNGQLVSALSEDSAQYAGQQLLLEKARLAKLSTRYTSMHPEVLALKKEVADLEKQAAEQRSAPDRAAGSPEADILFAPSLPPSAMGEFRRMRAQLDASKMDIASLGKEKKGILKGIAAVERKIQQAPRREQEMISLIRDYENQKQSYDDLLRKKLEADVSQDLEKRQKGTQFQILDPANLPEEPFTPDRRKVMGGSLMLALFLGFGGAIFLEGMDQRLRDVPDFKHLYKVPILGCIQWMPDQRYRRAQAWLRAAVLCGLVTFTLAFSVFLLVYNEKIRTILKF